MMTTLDREVRQQKFFLDTCATTHICPNPERFESLSICSSHVSSSSGDKIDIHGIGTVILNCIIDNKISKFIMHDVLYVPMLQHPLFSWKKERTNGYTLYDNGNKFCILKNDIVCLKTDFNGQFSVIKETNFINQESPYMTYNFWHEAPCSFAPSSVTKTEKFIAKKYHS